MSKKLRHTIKKTLEKERVSQSFAENFAELSKIVAAFEQNKLDLDASLQNFERGLQLAAELKKTLGTVENKIHALQSRYGNLENGEQEADTSAGNGVETEE